MGIQLKEDNGMKSVLKIKPPVWFWLIAVAALVWNGMGLMAFIDQMQMTTDDFAKLPKFDQQMYNTTPIWVTIAFGAAVIFGVLGSLAMLVRKDWASNFFLISLLAVLVQMTHMFFFSGFFQEKGWDMAMMPVAIVVVAVLLWSYAVTAVARHWIY